MLCFLAVQSNLKAHHPNSYLRCLSVSWHLPNGCNQRACCPPQVKRYWAGKAPEWATAEPDEDLRAAAPAADAAVRTSIAAPVIVKRSDDPRLQRLQQNREGREEAVQRHREIRAAEIVRRRERPASKCSTLITR